MTPELSQHLLRRDGEVANVRIELPDERKGMAQGLTSIRKTRNVQRYAAGETPLWINPAPWAGNGYRDYLKQRAAAAT